ncbi:MAG: hypothetical protein KC593_09305 [Myxococcales bacterium]|nr:hypothetical protein [Myxococcales bacterium]MCB9625740.1 hypothetical protein [Sandaracinaceae bacterium]
MQRHVSLFALTALLLIGAASVASVANAQYRVPQRRYSIEGYFIGEFLGAYRLRVNGDRRPANDIDLDPTLGAGVRVSLYSGVFAFGLMTEFRGYGNNQYSDRDFAFDISPFVGMRIPVLTNGTNVVRLRGTVPFGFTVLKPNSEAWGGDAYLGFNTGLLGGVEISFGNFGVFTDLGVRFHRVYANNDIALVGRADASLSWAQLSLNVGAQLAF